MAQHGKRGLAFNCLLVALYLKEYMQNLESRKRWLFQWALSQENWNEIRVNARVPRPSYVTSAGVASSWNKNHQKSLVAVSQNCSLDDCLTKCSSVRLRVLKQLCH